MDRYCIVANNVQEPPPNTDIGINISLKDSPRPECSFPYLDISDESPTFDKGLSGLTSVKKNLCEKHPFSPERKNDIIENIPLKPIKLKNLLEDVESDTSESFSTITDNSFDVDFRIPSTSTSNSDEDISSKKLAPVFVSILCHVFELNSYSFFSDIFWF